MSMHTLYEHIAYVVCDKRIHELPCTYVVSVWTVMDHYGPMCVLCFVTLQVTLDKVICSLAYAALAAGLPYDVPSGESQICENLIYLYSTLSQRSAQLALRFRRLSSSLGRGAYAMPSMYMYTCMEQASMPPRQAQCDSTVCLLQATRRLRHTNLLPAVRNAAAALLATARQNCLQTARGKSTCGGSLAEATWAASLRHTARDARS